ncbi:UDP-glucose 4-epimerase [Rhodobium orientis]|uniref:Epimerase n=1 Tax=Rhodobium orientis TaxID=34017 RepID=A0A327JN77_9HYPH|nr:NAD-dependent epimerase/dehydratase family protein [Rhodobium orientis]MBB4303637.1 UDP-glucose 4-epimerase [Rhodobium orientis]MBK5951907.1 epimerase [Rhodobium orientis]RAI26794.1 epimerase [Rhodobium orientis]
MHVLITGGAGFVGTNLTAHLNRLGGHQVRVLDNETLGKREHLGDLDVDFIHGDIRDREAVSEALDGIDAVVHLAADTRVIDSIEDPRKNFENNVIGTFNVLEAMRDRGINRFVGASTGGAILGEVPPPVHEEMVPHPASPYGASKLAVEGFCSAFSASYGLRSVSLRFSNVYGPRSFHKGSVVAHFFKQIMAGKPLVVYGDGSQVRDYVYVENLADGIVAALTCDFDGAIQLGTGKPTTLNELIAAMREVVAPMTFEVEYRDFRAGEIHSTYCDISRARDVLGFSPRMDLKEGLAATWAWFQSR